MGIFQTRFPSGAGGPDQRCWGEDASEEQLIRLAPGRWLKLDLAAGGRQKMAP